MRRLFLCLLIATASAGVSAREDKAAGPDGASCPEATSPRPSRQKVAPPRESSPSRETRVRPGMSGDADAGSGRPRWHSFLPGMFR